MENINEFLQSEEWRKFQEAVGRKTYCITGDNFYASVIKHSLPIVGSYFYVPRGPVIQISNFQFPISNKIPNSFSKLINLAKENNIGWIRIEPASENVLNLLRPPRSKYKITKAPHDMQPREILMMDITRSEEELLAGMKSKTRYNIKLAQKQRVIVRSNPKWQIPIKQIENSNEQIPNFILTNLLRLVKITAERDGITSASRKLLPENV